MIGSLRGTIAAKDPAGELLVEIAGLGYRVRVTPGTLAQAGAVGDDCFLHVHHLIKEEASDLYGFVGTDDRRCFEALLGAQGVGPALAMTVLSHLPPSQLRTAVATDDVNALKAIPGIGAKTAQRMLLDLKNKIGESDTDAVATHSTSSGPMPVLAEVRAALAQMGFEPGETNNAIAAATAHLQTEPDANAGVLLKVALQRLGTPA